MYILVNVNILKLLKTPLQFTGVRNVFMKAYFSLVHPLLEYANSIIKFSTMKFKEIDVTIRNGVQIIKFNRPNKKNAFTSLMYQEVQSALKEGGENDQVSITALTGAGDYYSSGNDITSYAAFDGGDMEKVIKEASNRVNTFVSAFIDFPKILIAMVNGPAIGIAVTTLGLCDVVYASKKASEMLYFNRKLSAEEAQACGLVSELFTCEDAVWARIGEYAKLPALSMHYSKRLVRRWDVDNLHETNDSECKQLEERWRSEDCMNAILGFFERRSKI